MPAFDPPFPLSWAVGDLVYARYVDPTTGRYVARLEGMVVRIEGAELVLATDSGEVRCSAQAWPRWKTLADAEAHLKRDPTPYTSSLPMAHYTAPAPEPPWECLRCLQIVEGLVTVPDHAPRCPYRGTGRDPDPRG